MLLFSPYEFCQLLAQMCLFYWVHKWHSAFMCLFLTSPCILLLHWEDSSTKLNLWMNSVSRVTEWSRSSCIELFSAVWSRCSDQKLFFFPQAEYLEVVWDLLHSPLGGCIGLHQVWRMSMSNNLSFCRAFRQRHFKAPYNGSSITSIYQRRNQGTKLFRR